MSSTFIKMCIKCRHFVVVEEKIGYCKLFDNLQNARTNKLLCGPDGKYFSPLMCEKPPSCIIGFPWFINRRLPFDGNQ